jgi:hypothetical protein
VLIHFEISAIGISQYARTGGYRTWVSRELKLRNIITCPRSIISRFRKSGFRATRRQEVLHLGFPGVETLKHPNSRHAMPFRGFASQGFGTGEYKRLASRYPRCRNTETINSSQAILFRGFATGEYKGSYP